MISLQPRKQNWKQNCFLSESMGILQHLRYRVSKQSLTILWCCLYQPKHYCLTLWIGENRIKQNIPGWVFLYGHNTLYPRLPLLLRECGTHQVWPSPLGDHVWGQLILKTWYLFMKIMLLSNLIQLFDNLFSAGWAAAADRTRIAPPNCSGLNVAQL